MRRKVLMILMPIVVILALVLLVLIIYCVYVFSSYYRLDDNLELDVQHSGDSVQTIEANNEYKLLSYNIGFGAYSDDYSFFMDGGSESRARSEEAVYENIGGAMQAVQDAAPDMVLLQEVDVDGVRSHHVDEVALVEDELPELGWRVFAQNYDSPYLFWPLNAPHGANKAGQLTLSAYEITSAVRRSLPIEDGFMKLVDLDRCYSVSRLPVEGGGELVLYNLHLSAYTSDGTIAEEQLEMLLADMKGEVDAGNWAIAGGDFNKDLLGNSSEIFGVGGPDYTWAQPIPAEIVPEGLAIIAPFDESNPVASCRNADKPYDETSYRVTVDGFIVSSNVDVLADSVIDTGFRYSDHNPAELRFTLR